MDKKIYSTYDFLQRVDRGAAGYQGHLVGLAAGLASGERGGTSLLFFPKGGCISLVDLTKGFACFIMQFCQLSNTNTISHYCH